MRKKKKFKIYPEMAELLELEDKDFKRAIINMFTVLNEKMDITREHLGKL